MANIWARLTENWVYGGFLAGLLLLVLFPVITIGWISQEYLAFLVLPVYMLHQFEEHNGDRFRIFFNQTIGKGYPVLSKSAVFIINIIGVWFVLAIAYLAMRFLSAGWGIVAIYLISINSAAHIIPFFIERRYNPGLITACIMFVPLSVYYSWTQDQISIEQNAIGFAIAFGIHALIMIYARAQYQRLVRHTHQ